ncbi:MAG TPA: integrase core domain-containing protein, partial [Bacteroidota bacterium]|nr:integrase core domain-containing protein [Bacteroidota bacterium]
TEQWRRHYNAVRPHSSLGYRPPAPETHPFPQVANAWRPGKTNSTLVRTRGAGQCMQKPTQKLCVLRLKG